MILSTHGPLASVGSGPFTTPLLADWYSPLATTLVFGAVYFGAADLRGLAAGLAAGLTEGTLELAIGVVNEEEKAPLR